MHKLAPVICALVLGCHARSNPAYPGFVDAPVAPVAAQASGRVVSVPVHRGDLVTRGQVLAQLDSRENEALVAQAEANLERANRVLDQAQANFHGTAPAVTGAGAEVTKARAALEEANLEFGRAARLFATKAISQAELDSARAKLKEAQATVDSLRATKAQVQTRVPAASATVRDAQGGVQAAQAALDLARVRLDQTRITAPFDGMVVSRDLEEGQWAAIGLPVVTVEEISEPWVRLDMPETQFRNLGIGTPARIHVVALGRQTHAGHVVEIAAQGDFALNTDVKRGRPEIRTFLVRVAFDAPLPAVRPGMTADVTFTGGPAQRPPVASRP